MSYTVDVDTDKVKRSAFSFLNKAKEEGLKFAKDNGVNISNVPAGVSRSSSSELAARAAHQARKDHDELIRLKNQAAEKSSSSGLVNTAKELYGQFSNSPKAQMVAGGTAAALGAGLAAKRYMQRKKK